MLENPANPCLGTPEAAVIEFGKNADLVRIQQVLDSKVAPRTQDIPELILFMLLPMERYDEMSEALPDDSRLRPHPEARFAPRQIEIDLNATTARLRAEPRAGERGHRQETLYREGGLTIALFAFERFTNLPPHRAAGVVNMHVLRGRLKITAGNEVYELQGGQMLILAPNIEHAVAAEEQSEMLLTVRLDKV